MLSDFANLFTCISLVILLVSLLRQRKKIRQMTENSNLSQGHSAPVLADCQKSERKEIRMHCRLREVREKAGMTISDLARESGVSQGHISEIEEERLIPTIFVAKKLAKALGVTVDELISEEAVVC